MSSQHEIAFDLDATNLCKGIAICVMVYYHLFGATDLTWFQPVLPVVFNVLAPFGNVCVVFFSLLSGYGYGASTQHGEALPSYGQQIVPGITRLYFNYWAVFLPFFLIVPFWSSGQVTWTGVYGSAPIQFIQNLTLDFFGLTHYVYGGNIYTLCQTWWYVTLALILILIMPLFLYLWNRTGWGLFALVLAAAFFLPDVRYLAYLPSAALGVCLARSNGFAAVRRVMSGPVKVLLQCGILLAILYLWYRMRQKNWNPVLADTMAAWAVCQFGFDLLHPIPGIRQILVLLGRHSGNIFYVHSLLFAGVYLGSRFFYRFHYDVIIWGVTMGASLLVSVLLEKIKGATGYPSLAGRCQNWLLQDTGSR